MHASPLRQQYLFAAAFPVTLFAIGAAGAIADPGAFARGLAQICTSPSILLHDYLAVGGFAAAMFNAGALGLLSVLLLKVLGIGLSGPFVAAIYTVTGFAFFGKNLVNVWPIIFGVFLYSRVKKTPFRNFAVVALFGTTLAPLASVIAFGGWITGAPAFALALAFGTAAGFVLPPLASHMLRFHDGYNIYNIGFTGGIVGSFFMAVLRSYDFSASASPPPGSQYNSEIQIVLYVFFALAIAGGILAEREHPRELLKALQKIHLSSGRLVSDFTVIGSWPAACVNIGVMGFIASLLVRLLGGDFNGPVIAGILTVAGFAAFGKHAANSIPVLVGVVIAANVKIWDVGSTTVIIAGLFGTTLAPIAGQFGPIAGVLAGFFHLSIVHNVGILHGGVNLYNNGFAGGFVASFLVPIINALHTKEKRA